MKIKGIIFDLDGTLLDSMKCWENVDQCFLRENGVEPPKGISDIVKKMTINDSAMYFKTQFSLKQSCGEIIDRIEEMVRERYFNTIPLKDGAYEAVHSLGKDGLKMCVATATYNNLAYAALKRLGIFDCFDFIITCSDVGIGKNDPEIFFRAAEKMGCAVNETVVIEDSLHCIETASAAGFRTIAVYDEVSANEWNDIRQTAWRYVNDPSKIEMIIKENI
ncbi:MAG: HAD family phosphatase [Clostridium sp.]|nr:HAD family phosphatase [Clostridium sp.]MCM1546837.1 HAD family phosphatase [Ruminococcus sp.]